MEASRHLIGKEKPIPDYSPTAEEAAQIFIPMLVNLSAREDGASVTLSNLETQFASIEDIADKNYELFYRLLVQTTFTYPGKIWLIHELKNPKSFLNTLKKRLPTSELTLFLTDFEIAPTLTTLLNNYSAPHYNYVLAKKNFFCPPPSIYKTTKSQDLKQLIIEAIKTTEILTSITTNSADYKDALNSAYYSMHLDNLHATINQIKIVCLEKLKSPIDSIARNELLKLFKTHYQHTKTSADGLTVFSALTKLLFTETRIYYIGDFENIVNELSPEEASELWSLANADFTTALSIATSNLQKLSSKPTTIETNPHGAWLHVTHITNSYLLNYNVLFSTITALSDYTAIDRETEKWKKLLITSQQAIDTGRSSEREINEFFNHPSKDGLDESTTSIPLNISNYLNHSLLIERRAAFKAHINFIQHLARYSIIPSVKYACKKLCKELGLNIFHKPVDGTALTAEQLVELCIIANQDFSAEDQTRAKTIALTTFDITEPKHKDFLAWLQGQPHGKIFAIFMQVHAYFNVRLNKSFHAKDAVNRFNNWIKLLVSAQHGEALYKNLQTMVFISATDFTTGLSNNYANLLYALFDIINDQYRRHIKYPYFILAYEAYRIYLSYKANSTTDLEAFELSIAIETNILNLTALRLFKQEIDLSKIKPEESLGILRTTHCVKNSLEKDTVLSGLDIAINACLRLRNPDIVHVVTHLISVASQSEIGKAWLRAQADSEFLKVALQQLQRAPVFKPLLAVISSLTTPSVLSTETAKERETERVEALLLASPPGSVKNDETAVAIAGCGGLADPIKTTADGEDCTL